MSTEAGKTRGDRAERQAQRYLSARGLLTVKQNYRCKMGEIDLIMRDGDTLVFVEVRFRDNPDYGTAAETVTPRKQQKIIRAAKYYLQSEGLTEKVSCRFDVLAMDRASGDGIDSQTEAAVKTQWLQDAFSAYG